MSRFRWVAKYRVLRYSGAGLLDPASLRYLLWDPEVESHSFEIGNVDEMVAFCVDAFDLPAEDVRRYVAEARSDPEFTTLLRRRTRWAFDLKTQPPLAQRLLWWVLVRGQKPELIVETGIYEGLGSLVLLVAAERNRSEGGPDARVVSVDSDPRSGRLVPKHLEHRWERVIGAHVRGPRGRDRRPPDRRLRPRHPTHGSGSEARVRAGVAQCGRSADDRRRGRRTDPDACRACSRARCGASSRRSEARRPSSPDQR